MGRTAPTAFAESDPRIRARFVEQLYADTHVLAMGMVASMAALLMTYAEAPRPALVAIGVAMTLVGIWRLMHGLRFRRLVAPGTLKGAEVERWERAFTGPAVIYVLLFGAWCLESALYGSSFGQLVAICATMANLIGICGRSYALRRLVDAQLLAAFGPIALGLMLEGGPYPLLAIWMVPFGFSLQRITAWQRARLLETVVARMEAERSAARFNAALDAVPEAVCQFDAAGSVEVVNARMARLARREPEALIGLGYQALLTMFQDDGNMPDDAVAQLHDWMGGTRRRRLELHFEGGPNAERSYRLRIESAVAQSVIVLVEDITREVRDAHLLDRATRIDPLTSLINRAELRRTLRRALEPAPAGEPDRAGVGVMLIHLRRFNAVNEAYGLRFGDAVLGAFARLLEETCGAANVCARFGDEDFVVVAQGEGAADVLAHLADTLVERASRPVEVEGRPVRLNLLVGVAISGEARDEADLLRQADVALAAARERDGSAWTVFDAAMGRRVDEQRRMKVDLRRAIETDAIEMHYQPIVDLRRGTASVCEALARWTHPELGPVAPYKFVPIAEETGLVVPMGRQALARACRDCVAWPGDTRVAVNLSALQLTGQTIVDDVRDALRHSGLAPHRLELEVTESILMDDLSGAVRRLRTLKELGVSIALDDFGTGYSSLSYLRRLPVDKVKLDRAFTRDLGSDAAARDMVAGIIAMAHRIGMEVTVEGVEDEPTLAFLNEVGADLIQGWLFAKAVPAGEACALVDPRTPAGRRMLAPIRPLAATQTAALASA